MNYKEALKHGFFEMQIARDWYREITSDVGMHADVIKYWIRIAALLIQPVVPHMAEHIWSTILKETCTVQLACWPTPSRPINRALIDAGTYIRTTVKSVREAEGQLLRKTKAKGGTAASFDPRKPKSLRIYVAVTFPDWQMKTLRIIKDSYQAQGNKVDDANIRQLLGAAGLMKDKRVMPFVQTMKVCSPILGGYGQLIRNILN